MQSAVTAAEINAFFAEHFPERGGSQSIVKVERDYARMRFDMDENHLRPGGFVSGPTQMGLADGAAYVAVFTRLGIVPMAVTSSLTINFLRPCIGSAVVAEANLLKLGRSLAVIEVSVRADGSDKVSSHAVVNYALPSAPAAA